MTPLRAFLVSTTTTFLLLVVGYSTALAAPTPIAAVASVA